MEEEEDNVVSHYTAVTDDKVDLYLTIKGVKRKFTLLTCHVAFTEGWRIVSNDSWKMLQNKFISYMTNGEYTHSEIVFKFMDMQTEEYIYAGCVVQKDYPIRWLWRTESFNMIYWEVRTINITEKQQRDLFVACRDDVNRNIEFNSWMELNFLLPWFLKVDMKGEAYWCSEHVATRLKDIGVPGFETVQPYTISPSALYSKVMTVCNTLTLHPSVLRSLHEWKIYDEVIVSE